MHVKVVLLAAGLGTRLKPLTDVWPKCLMPIHGIPLLDYWLWILYKCKVRDILVNTHYFSKYVDEFIDQKKFNGWVSTSYERELLGTAGTLRNNKVFCSGSTILLVHADNWVCCDFTEFLHYHYKKRPKDTVMTMMTYVCPEPSECGVVKIDHKGIVTNFYEKVENPPGKLANAAVYLIEPEVIKWVLNNKMVTDFSTEVLPEFLGRIATWENTNIHRDIGTIESLRAAQKDCCDKPMWNKNNLWQKNFLKNPVQSLIKK
jgi:mannose-1-phosphate guanylyltransferase